MQAEVRRSSRLCIFSADGALMSDDLWADQGGQRRRRRLRKGKERKDGTEGRRCGCLRMCLHTIIVLPLTILLPSWRKRQQVRYPSEDHIFYPGQHMIFTWIHSTHAMPSLLSVLAESSTYSSMSTSSLALSAPRNSAIHLAKLQLLFFLPLLSPIFIGAVSPQPAHCPVNPPQL